MKKRLTKGLACLLAATMMIGGAMTVLGAEGTTSGSGGLEGSVETDVVRVTLPTVADEDTTFDFVLDPEGLIAETGGARYEDKVFEEGKTVYFPVTKTESQEYDYASNSNKLTVINKGTTELTVTVTATVTEADGIVWAADASSFDGSETSLYLALVDDAGENAIADGAATMTGTIEALDKETAYETVWNGTAYEYKLKDDFADFTTYDFWMTGACDPTADWSALTEMAPVVEITWTVEGPDGEDPEEVEDEPVVVDKAPSIATTDYTFVASTDLEITVDLGEGDLAATDIASITFVNMAGSTTTIVADKYEFDPETGVLTMDSAWVDVQLGQFEANDLDSREYTITFNDEAATEVVVTIAK